MPVTKTAKRALRNSIKKRAVNNIARIKLEVAVKKALKSKSIEDISKAMSLVDKLEKIKAIHKNKAARTKSRISKIGSKVG